ncbi:hypothetical protein [Pseudonocardia asaccharolytica]|uniref:Alpha/beta hydrolase n=1 Tax=Pseudonocardia asaccharolytica DSM 44247 = NBRC 16224 TaxID=1123024 RepID=A0A511D9T9_9PSEU|nr:hypothetical protein [Pseudonocardia asaccharolytica]GEL20404.1 hypothetical protein PA7_42410 [Pseudonocardia asaccharolytica DSM 44247 = NBRC 16224]
MFAASSAVVLLTFVATVVAGPRPEQAPAAVPGDRLVEVATGSRLQVLTLAGRGPGGRTPVVVLHGGPGVPDLAANARVFAPLTDGGFDVYLYAQLRWY